MLFFVRRWPVVPKNLGNIVHTRRYSSTAVYHGEPLRILFCGSEEFSAASLNRLYEEHQKDSSFIASIDVVCKEGKKTGRGLKTIRHVPIKEVAENMSLPIHQIPTFTGWYPPVRDSPINLIIAVSFGLLVPPRILGYAKYGGINLHPSLLPDLRGPAPLHHAIMQGRSSSGITLQTLHPRHFDRGLILAQEAFEMPNKSDCTVEEFRGFIAPRAADFLVECLRQGVFINPTGLTPVVEASQAPKLRKEHAEVDWTTWSAEQILRTQNVIAPLWNTIVFKDGTSKEHRLRVQWGKFALCSPSKATLLDGTSALPFVGTLDGEDEERCLIGTCDDQMLTFDHVTFEGRPRDESAIKMVKQLTDGKLRPSTLKKQDEIVSMQLAQRGSG